MNGLFAAARTDQRPLDRGEIVEHAAVIGFREPTVQMEHVVLFADGWARSYLAPDGLCVAGCAHLVDRDGLSAQADPELELVADLYRRHGSDAFAQLRGQFCLIVCDPHHRRVVVATDRFATREVYYAQHGGCLLLSSRVGWLPARHRQTLDHQALLEYLVYTAIPHPRTAFAAIRKLSPAQALTAEASGVRTSSYWDMQYPEEGNGDIADWARRLRDQMEDTVRRYVTAEAAIEESGAFLSGGTDSSAVAGMLARIARTPLKAFSIGYAEPGYDELEYARTAAAWFGLTHHTHRLTPEEAFATLDEIVGYYEEPFGNSSALPTYACARLARAHGVTAMFAGDGGDELFGGNERYRTNEIFRFYQRLPFPLRKALTDPLFALLPDGVPILGQARRYVRRSNIPNPKRLFSYNLLLAEPLEALLTPAFLTSVQPDAVLVAAEDHYHRAPHPTSELNRLLYLDLKLAIADNDVRKVSGMAELAGVDVRYPLLDVRLAEFSGRIPTRLKLRRLEKRYLFKRALADFLPPAILSKPKHGFGAPVAGWLKTDRTWRALVLDLLHDRRTRERGYFLPAALDRLWQLHLTEPSSYYGDSLWPLLMLELWHRRHTDGVC